MSMDINESFVRQYESEVHEAYQRRGSLLGQTVRRKNNVKGESTTFQKVGKGTAVTKTRHGVITPMNVDHTPVECPLGDYYAGDWVDHLDELKVNHNERKVQVNAGAYALGRKTDELITTVIDSATNAQTEVDASLLTAGHLTDWVAALGARDVPMNDGDLFGVVTWNMWSTMMGISQFSNADYIGDGMLPYPSPVRPRFWLGVIWIVHSGLTVASTVSTNAIYHRSAIGFASGCDVKTDITWHGDRAAHWINNMMSQGAVLIDDNGIEQFPLDEDG